MYICIYIAVVGGRHFLLEGAAALAHVVVVRHLRGPDTILYYTILYYTTLYYR